MIPSITIRVFCSTPGIQYLDKHQRLSVNLSLIGLFFLLSGGIMCLLARVFLLFPLILFLLGAGVFYFRAKTGLDELEDRLQS